MSLTWRILIVVAIAIGGLVVWYTQARNAALLADSLGTSQFLGTKSLGEISWNGTYPVIDDEMLGLTDSHDVQAMQLNVDAGRRLIATANGKSIVLGVERGTLMKTGDPEPQPAFHAEQGDRITLTRARGRLIWPNWFETNYMTGATPQWKRFITYRLRWQKPNGASLELFWRFEQYYFPMDGWVAANMTGETDCGLVEVRIVPGAN